MQDKINKIEDFTKEEILLAIKKVLGCEEKLMMELPIARYNSMYNKAKSISEQASIAAKGNNIKEAMLLFDESNALCDKANKFIDTHNKRNSI